MEDKTEIIEQDNYLNALMTLIVNRAAAFKREKFDCIVTDFPDTPQGCVGFNLANIIAMTRNIQVYCPKECTKTRFWEDLPTIKPLGKIAYKMAKKKKTSLKLNMTNEAITNPAFIDVDDSDLIALAKTFYNWVDLNEEEN